MSENEEMVAVFGVAGILYSRYRRYDLTVSLLSLGNAKTEGC